MSAAYCAVCDSEDCRCLDPRMMALRAGPPDQEPVETIEERVARLEAVVAELTTRALLRPEREAG